MIQAAYAKMTQEMEEAVVEETTPIEVVVEPVPEVATLSDVFPDLDSSTIPEDMVSDLNLDISDITELGIKTVQGDSVWAIDRENGILIVEVTGDQFVGKLAIIRDPAQVDLAANTPGTHGTLLGKFCEDSGALLGINASGFYDPDGVGVADIPTGLVLKDGVELNPARSGNYHIVGFDANHNLLVGRSLDTSTLVDAVQFYPCLVVDGEVNISTTLGMGIQPRSAIGQTKSGSVLMCVIDGRQVGYSVGATVVDVADILLKYDCWSACGLDGGSSAVMWYKGSLITKTSSPSKETGRYLPDAWVVLPADSGEEETSE
jgi:exopolysaccharide biosynthesis protein